MKNEEILNNKHICSATMDHIGKHDNYPAELLTGMLIGPRDDETTEADCFPSSMHNAFYWNTMISFLNLMFELVLWVQNPLLII